MERIFNRKNQTVFLFLLGLGLGFWEYHNLTALSEQCGPYWLLPGLVVAALLGMGLRGLARKVFFGRQISVHQSWSFDALVDGLARLNPWGNYYGFEKWFTIRETGWSETEVDLWLYLRTRWLWLFGVGGLTMVLAILGKITAAIVIGGAGILTAGWFVIAARQSCCTLFQIAVFYLVVFGVEGGIFIGCSGPWVGGYLPAAALYLLFNLCYYFSPIPYGIGFAELPVLLLPVHNVWNILLVFHLTKVVLLLPVQMIYWARYKFQLEDFFIPSIMEKIRASIRPGSGWSDPTTTTPDRPEVSVVIPAYNEELRLPVYLNKIRQYLEERSALSIEVIIVDDGSRDGTAELAEAEAVRDGRFRLVRQLPNQGKGAAVRRGVMAARGHYVLYADADGATPIEELDKLLVPARQGAEVVIGSRRIAAVQEARQRNLLRAMMGMTFYKTVNYFAVPGIRDSQCGFKLFRHDAAVRLFSAARENGWAFDVELLYLAQLYGYGIAETPVNWQEIAGSKVHPVKDALKMLLAVFRIRNRHRGFFNKNFLTEQAQ